MLKYKMSMLIILCLYKNCYLCIAAEPEYSFFNTLFLTDEQNQNLRMVIPAFTLPFTIEKPTLKIIKAIEASPLSKYQLFVVDKNTSIWYQTEINLTSIGTDRIIKNVNSMKWGNPEDSHYVCDFDGDGKQDLAVFREKLGRWLLRLDHENVTFTTGVALEGQHELVFDYNGDGKCDVGSFSQGAISWRSAPTFGSPKIFQLGNESEIPYPGNYNGDSVIDYAFFHPKNSIWHILLLGSEGQIIQERYIQWGLPGDTPFPADYDLDKKTDLAVYRKSTGALYVLKSESNYQKAFAQQLADPGSQLVATSSSD